MRRRLSTRSLAVLAVCLSTLSAMISWRSTTRYLTATKKCEREMTQLDSDVNDLEHFMLGLAALVQVASKGFPESRRVAPKDPRLAGWCEDIISSIPRLGVFETIRADEFLFWYYRQMKKLHPSEAGGKSVLVANDTTAKLDEPWQNRPVAPGFAEFERAD